MSFMVIFIRIVALIFPIFLFIGGTQYSINRGIPTGNSLWFGIVAMMLGVLFDMLLMLIITGIINGLK